MYTDLFLYGVIASNTWSAGVLLICLADLLTDGKLKIGMRHILAWPVYLPVWVVGTIVKTPIWAFKKVAGWFRSRKPVPEYAEPERRDHGRLSSRILLNRREAMMPDGKTKMIEEVWVRYE